MSLSQPAPRHPKCCTNTDNVTWHPVGQLTNCLGISGDQWGWNAARWIWGWGGYQRKLCSCGAVAAIAHCMGFGCCWMGTWACLGVCFMAKGRHKCTTGAWDDCRMQSSDCYNVGLKHMILVIFSELRQIMKIKHFSVQPRKTCPWLGMVWHLVLSPSFLSGECTLPVSQHDISNSALWIQHIKMQFLLPKLYWIIQSVTILTVTLNRTHFIC